MKSGGLNSVPDSFAPAPAADFPWQVRQLPKKTEGLRDTAEALAPEAKALDQETNKALFALLKTSKFLILMLVAPPYFFLFKFPRGALKIALPFIKTTQAMLAQTLKQTYDKAKNRMESALNRISTHVVRQMEGISNVLKKLKSAIYRSVKTQGDSLKSKLAPLAKATMWIANLSAKAYSSASAFINLAMEQSTHLKERLKRLTLPKIVFSNPIKGFASFREAYRNLRSYGADALQAAWNQAKELSDKFRLSCKKAADATKKRLRALSDLSSALANKIKNQAREIGKVASTVKESVQNTLVMQGEKLLVFVQQPYFALAPYALAMRGQAGRSFRAVNQAFKGVLMGLHTKVNAAKSFVIQSLQAFLMPFKRGGKFLKKHSQKLGAAIQKGGRRLAKRLQERDKKFKEKAKGRIIHWLRHVRALYSALKKIKNQVLHVLKLFFIWLKLMASFANFLMSELFREIKAWLASA